jgi:hypothetical protein
VRRCSGECKSFLLGGFFGLKLVYIPSLILRHTLRADGPVNVITC